MHADEKYRRLTPCPPCGQALWWNMLAGEQTDIIPGLFKIGEQAFAEQLGWGILPFREAFAELFREGLAKADWNARLVWIPNAIKYNKPANPNVVLSWRDAWHDLPECKLKVEAYQSLKAFVEPLGEPFAKAFAKLFDKSGTGTGTGTGTGAGSVPRKKTTGKSILERVKEAAKEKRQ